VNEAQLAQSDAQSAVPETIFRLIYRSRSRIPPAQLDTELGNILRVARTNNAERGITGALLVYDNWFAQALEGSEETVRDLYKHIATDKRHDSVQVREAGMVKARVFSRWAMAMVGEHGNPDIPLVATQSGTAPAAERRATPEQEQVLTLMRDATRGYGRGS
jgi:hypothetical protein